MEHCKHIRPAAGMKYCPACLKMLTVPRDEHDLQANMVHWFRAAISEDLAIITHHMNNQASKSMGVKAKILGVRKSFPDLIILAANGETILVEVKKEGGALDSGQKKLHKTLSNLSHEPLVIDSFDKFTALFIDEFKA